MEKESEIKRINKKKKKIVMTWKIVGVSEVSVLYIYILIRLSLIRLIRYLISN